EEALFIAERERPDLAILDLLLPRKDGFTLLLHLRARDATRAAPVIFVSSEPGPDHADIALGLGASAYLAKPWSGEEVMRAIADAVAGSLRAPESGADAKTEPATPRGGTS